MAMLLALALNPRVRAFSSVVMASALLIGAAGCKKRTFNSEGATRSAAATDKADTVAQGEFEAALFAAAVKAADLFPADDLTIFFNEDQISAINSKTASSFRIYSKIPYEVARTKATSENVWLQSNGLGSIPSGGLILVGKDVFPEGYFRVRSKAVKTEDLMTKAPWFQWDAATRAFVPRREGGSARLLSFLSERMKGQPTVTLYRGTNRPDSDPSFGDDPYAAGTPQPDALQFFSSPSINTAMSWASPFVVKADLPVAELLADVSAPKPTVYVGIEYSYIELAYLKTKDSPQKFVKDGRDSPYCIVKEKYDRPNHGYQTDSKYFAEDVKAAEVARATTPDCPATALSGHTSGLGENPLLKKKGKTKREALLKSYPFLDDDKEEGIATCGLPANTEFEYGEAFPADKGQTLIFLGRLDPKWDCPRNFRLINVYMDSDRIELP